MTGKGPKEGSSLLFAFVDLLSSEFPFSLRSGCCACMSSCFQLVGGDVLDSSDVAVCQLVIVPFC